MAAKRRRVARGGAIHRTRHAAAAPTATRKPARRGATLAHGRGAASAQQKQLRLFFFLYNAFILALFFPKAVYSAQKW